MSVRRGVIYTSLTYMVYTEERYYIKKHKDWMKEQWMIVVFSFESKFHIGGIMVKSSVGRGMRNL